MKPLNPSTFYYERVRRYEKQLIEDALSVSRSISGAARLLQLRRTTLVEKMKRLGIPLAKVRKAQEKQFDS